MWIPKKIKLNRFNAHKETEFEFIKGKTLLVQGKNYDDEGQESNGSGKSGIIEAAHTCLTGEQIRGKELSITDLIMRGEKDCSLEFSFFNIKDNRELIIKRKIFLKKSSRLQIFINNKEEEFATINEGNKRIFELLGINKEDLTSYFIINKEKYIPFFYTSDTKKKEVISRFSGASLLKDIDEIIQVDVGEKIENLSKSEKEILKLETKISIYEEQIEEEKKADKEKLKREEINSCNERITIYEDNIKKYKEMLVILVKSRDKMISNKLLEETEKKKIELQLDKFIEKKIEDEVVDINKAKETENTIISSIEDEIDKIKGRKQVINQDILDSESLKAELERSIAGKVECPKCKYEFVSGKKINVSDAKLSIIDLTEDVELFEKAIKDEDNKIEKKKLTIAKIEENIKRLNEQYKEKEIEVEKYNKKAEDYRKEISIQEDSISTLTRNIESKDIEIEENESNTKRKNKQILNVKEEIKEINNREEEDKVQIIKDKIKVIENDIKKMKEQCLKKEEEIEDTKIWIYNFKRFNSYLANKAISGIENYTNYYLDRIKTNLSIKVDGYKLLQNGDLREKITSQILRNGVVEGSFGTFSKGEKGKIELCNIVTLQQLINLNSPTGGVDLLMIDEVLDSIDSKGIEGIVTSMNYLKKTLVLITHSQHAKNENIRTVIKKNRVSKLER